MLSSAVKWFWNSALATEKAWCLLGTSQISLQTVSKQTFFLRGFSYYMAYSCARVGWSMVLLTLNVRSQRKQLCKKKKKKTCFLSLSFIYTKLTKHILGLNLAFFLGLTSCSHSHFSPQWSSETPSLPHIVSLLSSHKQHPWCWLVDGMGLQASPTIWSPYAVSLHVHANIYFFWTDIERPNY